MILAIMRADPRITVSEICAKTEIPERTVYREISVLKENGRVKTEGKTSAKTWVVMD